MKIALFRREASHIDEKKLNYLAGRLTTLGADIFYCTSADSGELPSDTDLMLSLGGDGTFLAAVDFLKGRQIPVAGINFGRLGFLTTARVDEGENAWIEDLVNKKFDIEPRLLLQASGVEMPEGVHPYCLNEFSLMRLGPSMLQITVSIDGKALPTYWADGVLVATPTGSTAYSLSVGGPIVAPTTECLIICPTAPHNLNVRPIVVSASSRIRISFRSKDASANMSVDNHGFQVSSDSCITLSQAPHKALYVTLRDMSFIDALRDKLMWGDDIRNNK
ncbi:MAG: NAD(+)/NADH kinase [Bacteroidales bacterium]|nr:NAD(+)/NADH kinase [Bacteroidales bacterium]MBO7584198.1 NAD(+)/NADH kinase [Bacteroidales bacterium]